METREELVEAIGRLYAKTVKSRLWAKRDVLAADFIGYVRSMATRMHLKLDENGLKEEK